MNLPRFPDVHLFSPCINALSGVLVARNPSDDRGYALVGLLMMAFFGGIAGGLSHDILLNDIFSPLKDPKHILVCILMGLPGVAIYRLPIRKGSGSARELWPTSNPLRCLWFAMLGAHKALDHDLGIYNAITIGLISTTAGECHRCLL